MFQGCPQNRVMLKRVCFNSLRPSEKWGYVKEACIKKHTEACVSSVSEKCCCVKEAHVLSSEKWNLAKEDSHDCCFFLFQVSCIPGAE